MIEQFISQLLETIEESGGRVSSVLINYYDGDAPRHGAFSALEIESMVKRNGWAELIESRLGEG